MAVVSIRETTDSRAGDSTVDPNTGRMIRKHTREWLVETNSKYDGSYTVLAACPVLVGDAHPEDTGTRARAAKCKQNSKTRTYWTLTVDYDNSGETPSGSRLPNPFASPAVITWRTDTTQVEFAFDKNGKPVLNSAGERFDHPLKDDVSFWTCAIKKNVPDVPSWFDSYRDAVNSDNIWIDNAYWVAGQCKIRSITISEWRVMNVFWYRELNLEITIKGAPSTKQDWKHYVLDQGFHYLDSNGKLQPCVTWNGTIGVAKTPQLLINTGVQYFGQRDATNVAANCVLQFDLRNLRPFSILPLY